MTLLTDGRDDGDGEEQRPGVRPQLRGVVIFAVPAIALRCHINLTVTIEHCKRLWRQRERSKTGLSNSKSH